MLIVTATPSAQWIDCDAPHASTMSLTTYGERRALSIPRHGQVRPVCRNLQFGCDCRQATRRPSDAPRSHKRRNQLPQRNFDTPADILDCVPETPSASFNATDEKVIESWGIAALRRRTRRSTSVSGQHPDTEDVDK